MGNDRGEKMVSLVSDNHFECLQEFTPYTYVRMTVHYCMVMTLGRDDWISVAVDALMKQGPPGVAILPLSKKLGATRGSFYWHFSSRAELLDAALGEYEKQSVDAAINIADESDSPTQRLRRILRIAFQADPAQTIDVVLSNFRDDLQVRPVLQRVVARRLSYMTDCFASLGFDPSAAELRGTMALATFMGWLQLPHDGSPESLREEGLRLARLLEQLITPAEPTAPPNGAADTQWNS